MPFTFSHPAVFVPLRRLLKRNVSATGLIVGSMVPDAEYFVRMKGMSRYGHSWPGVLWFDLPLGLLVAFIFHGFLRNAVIVQLPLFAQKKVWPLLQFNWGQWLRRHYEIVVVSFIAGSVSHILWDEFVHAGARFLNGLSEDYTALTGEDDFFIYYLFFGFNSLAGLAVLRHYFRQLPSYPVSVEKGNNFAFWTACAAFSAVIVMVRVIASEHLSFLSWIDSVIAAFLLSVLLTVFLQKCFSANGAEGRAGRAPQ